MNFQAILSRLCPCRRGTKRTEEPEPAPGAITEDVVWNCDPTAAPAEEEKAPEPSLLEQIQAQLAALPPRPPKTMKSVVDHMVEVRDRLIKDVIDYADNPTQLWISYQGAVNTLHWVFCAESDKTWDETIDGPAFSAVIEPMDDQDYYDKRVFPAWRWREVKLKPEAETK
jgi:hypothetical protein